MVSYIEQQIFIEKLLEFGLTRQEATIYMSLVTQGNLTGYEASKLTGISRSNVYNAMSGLVEKGAAYLMEGTSKKYTAVEIAELCNNKIRALQEEKTFLAENMPKPQEQTEGYITIEGDRHILDKMKNMLGEAKQRIYLSANGIVLDILKEELAECERRKIKVVLLTDQSREAQGATVYVSEDKGNQVRLIVDSRNVLTGDYGKGSFDTCLYSGQINFVNLVKDALRNEIKLIELTKG